MGRTSESASVNVSLWQKEMARRFLTKVMIKGILTTAAFPLFFIAYFWVMHNPAPFAELTVIPLLFVDHWIPVQQWALVPYASLWFYVCLPSSLIWQKQELIEYLLGAVFLCVLGIGIFWLLPTSVPDFGIDWSIYPGLAFLKMADGGANALPSLHAAFAIYTAAFLNKQLRSFDVPAALRVANVLWAVLIVYSTIATRQHVFLDALAGTALGVLAYTPVSKIAGSMSAPATQTLIANPSHAK